jgi:hypothetical protein
MIQIILQKLLKKNEMERLIENYDLLDIIKGILKGFILFFHNNFHYIK